MEGYVGETYFPLTEYLITITDDDETFLKIGITQKEVSERFNRNPIPYNYSINTIKDGILYELFVLEQRIHIEHNTLKYKPKKKFNGYSECYNIESENILREYFR